MSEIREFQIEIADEELEDLHERLRRTRWPDAETPDDWSQGVPLGYAQELCSYWLDEYDWRAREAQYNRFPQFVTEISGLDIHFIHCTSPHPQAIPLVMTHGWPGSISEFSKIIGPLTDPGNHSGDITDSFHIVAPSLPGFGFSGKPQQPGFNPEKIAHILAALMEKIGYQRYAIAGGDWGAIINRHLANHYPQRLIGLHSNMILASAPADEEARNAVTTAENQLRASRGAFMQNERAYQLIQGTKPQSLG